MNSEISKFIECITDTSEENVLKLLNPTDDRKEMGEIYESTLGYNPITYFDETVIRQKLIRFAETLPTQSRALLQDSYDDIVKLTLEDLESIRMKSIDTALIDAIKDSVDDATIDLMLARYEEDDYFDDDEDLDLGFLDDDDDGIDLSELEDVESDDDGFSYDD